MEWLELVERVQRDYPQLRFKAGKKFTFRPPRTIIFVRTEQIGGQLQLMHELGHVRLEHRFFRTDVERLKMERAAWEEAHKICEQYGVAYDEEFVEQQLDSYREWLHRRSQCPVCGLTRYQSGSGEYHCPGCELGRRA